MIDDFKIRFKVFVLDLLKEDFEFVFDLFGFVEEVELLSFTLLEVLVDEFIDKFLELLGASSNWHRIDSERLVFVAFELNPDVFGEFRLNFVHFDFFVSLHLNNLL